MTERRRHRILPILVSMVVALILAIGSFYGCSRMFMNGSSQKLNLIFFWSFLVCAGCFLMSMIWLLVTLVLNYIRASKERL